jgi:hypothetical protein
MKLFYNYQLPSGTQQIAHTKNRTANNFFFDDFFPFLEISKLFPRFVE